MCRCALKTLNECIMMSGYGRTSSYPIWLGASDPICALPHFAISGPKFPCLLLYFGHILWFPNIIKFCVIKQFETFVRVKNTSSANSVLLLFSVFYSQFCDFHRVADNTELSKVYPLDVIFGLKLWRI